jgi:hypothetical protein
MSPNKPKDRDLWALAVPAPCFSRPSSQIQEVCLPGVVGSFRPLRRRQLPFGVHLSLKPIQEGLSRGFSVRLAGSVKTVGCNFGTQRPFLWSLHTPFISTIGDYISPSGTDYRRVQWDDRVSYNALEMRLTEHPPLMAELAATSPLLRSKVRTWEAAGRQLFRKQLAVSSNLTVGSNATARPM